MNRRARRIQAREGKRLEWGKVKAQGTYADLGDNDARNLLLQVFRAVAGEVSDEVFEDEALFDGTMTLIRHGFLDIWFAIDGSNILVKSKLTPPAGGAA